MDFGANGTGEDGADGRADGRASPEVETRMRADGGDGARERR